MAQLPEIVADRDGNNAQKGLEAAENIIARARRTGTHLGRFLDVGCGIGTLMTAAQPYAESVTGVDGSERFVNAARSRLVGASVMLGDVHDLARLDDDAFDTIALCDVIEHLGNPATAIAELRRVLRPNGRLIVTTPNTGSFLRFVLGKRWHGLTDSTHLLLYSSFSLGVFLERSGFEIAERGTLSGPYLPIALQRPIDFFAQGGTLLVVATKSA